MTQETLNALYLTLGGISVALALLIGYLLVTRPSQKHDNTPKSESIDIYDIVSDILDEYIPESASVVLAPDTHLYHHAQLGSGEVERFLRQIEGTLRKSGVYIDVKSEDFDEIETIKDVVDAITNQVLRRTAAA